MTDTVSDRACKHLDRIRANDPSKHIIMDLLDEILAKEGRYKDEAAENYKLRADIERLRSALAAEREECAKVAEDCSDFAKGRASDDCAIIAKTANAIASAIRARR